jgi:DNA-binding PadR family transcriptional regulator
MRYSLFVNQPVAIELGMENTTEAHLFGELIIAPTWADDLIVDGKVYYWVARQRICDALPLLDLKPDTVYRYMKKLASKGLIEYKKVGKKDCIRITPLGKKYVTKTMSEKNPNFVPFAMSEKNPKKLGKKSEKTRKKIRHINILSNSIIKDTHTETESDPLFEQWLDEYCYRSSAKNPLAYKAMMRKKFHEGNEDAQKAFQAWRSAYLEKYQKEEYEKRINSYDYTQLAGMKLGERTIIRVVDTGSNLHLFFDDGTDDYNYIKRDIYQWIQQKHKEAV